jgi:hypothetical protein
MGITHLGRVVVAADTQANIEALGFDLDEVIFGVDTSTDALGFSIDDGATWVWITASAPAAAAELMTDDDGSILLDDDNDLIYEG